MAGLVLLLPGYITEFGFYGRCWLRRCVRRGDARLDEAERTALVLALSALGLATFLRSTVVANNDFGSGRR